QPRMPLVGKPLTNEEIAVIRGWIDEGARPTPSSAPAKPKWEAPLSLARPPLPVDVWAAWKSPLDRIAAAYLMKNGVTEPRPVSDALFARRAYLDIQGLLPAPDELQSFVSDKDINKREKLVSTLLASDDKYAEHWI